MPMGCEGDWELLPAYNYPTGQTRVVRDQFSLNQLCPTVQGLTLVATMIAPRATHSSDDGFERNRLICERRAFSSSVRFLTLRGITVGTRFAGR